jgi:predicted neutral ceramidase superfamily lipid hydrolase
MNFQQNFEKEDLHSVEEEFQRVDETTKINIRVRCFSESENANKKKNIQKI